MHTNPKMFSFLLFVLYHRRKFFFIVLFSPHLIRLINNINKTVVLAESPLIW